MKQKIKTHIIKKSLQSVNQGKSVIQTKATSSILDQIKELI